MEGSTNEMDKKLLTVAVPCYNSAAYMRHAIDTLLPGGKDLEILIVDDGSTDGTAKIADLYARRYPDIVRAIHQPNGGHGEAVNAGIRNARGLYFKVLDSDDWVSSPILKKILRQIQYFSDSGDMADLIVTNFVYDKVGKKHKKVMRYADSMPRDQLFTWDRLRFSRIGEYLLMHSVIYRTEVLRESGLQLPAHAFYVDNIYVYTPLPYVQKIYYMDMDFYHYFIGRSDQSVNQQVMIGRLDQQFRVNRIMIEAYRLYDPAQIPNRHLRRYMQNYLEIVTTISSVLAIISKDPENYRKKDELWAFLEEKDLVTYRHLRIRPFGLMMHTRTEVGRAICRGGYHLAQAIFGFN